VYGEADKTGQTQGGIVDWTEEKEEPAPPSRLPAPQTKTGLSMEERKKYCARRVMECRSSGKKIRDWCQENGVGLTTFYTWQKEARENLLKIMHELNKAIPQPEPQKPTVALPEPAEPPTVGGANREPVPAAAPSGWAVCQPEREETDSEKGITIEIGKGRITATAETDAALLKKVCRILVEL
jgi:transposase-like protein